MMPVRFEKMSVSKFILMLVAIFAILIVSVAAASFTGGSAYFVYFIQILFYILMFIGFYYLGLTRRERKLLLAKGVEKKPLHLAVVPFLVGGLVTFLYVLALQQWLPGLYESYMEAAEQMQGVSLYSDPLELVLMFISVVILAPIVEEIVFRGIFFNLLNKKRSTLTAMIVSSLVFGFLHAETMVPTAVIGFVLCFIYHRTGSLLLVMAGHMVNNLIAFSLPLFIGDADPSGMGLEVLGGILVLFYIAASIYFISYVVKNRGFLAYDGPMHRAAGVKSAYRKDHETSERKIPLEGQKIIDISKALVDGMPVYPGDPEVEIREVRSISQEGYAVRSIQMNTHASTHMDFPSHFIENGGTQDDVDLNLLYGEVRVAETSSEFLPEGTVRVIFKDGYIAKERAQALIEGGIKVVGTALDSIEEGEPYEVHKMLLKSGIIILENLNLSHVACGRYTLSAFPLKISGAEAAPARVVLIDGLRRYS
ncbi:type II CAAX prenyl endopeptidase Rce1 family protein [Proteiniclasticum sp. C24MP]|uniref:CPBP family glutamic-type intramembrane protease n=1 Tax=Proteiniclasticum sp. C24MP TaxID=3374101 RepID=UPI00375451F2